MTYKEKYKDMSDKWLIKRRRSLLNPSTRPSQIMDNEIFKTWSNEKIKAVLKESDAIEDILEDRADKRSYYAEAAQSWGG
jgi:hypothetical protein